MKRTTPLKRKTPLRARKDSIPRKHWDNYRRCCVWGGRSMPPGVEHRHADRWLVGRMSQHTPLFKVWFYDGQFRDGNGEFSAVMQWAERVPLPNKYGARTKRVEVPGEGGEKVARSLNGMEREWGGMLEMRQRAGEISELRYQTVFHLTHPALPGLDIPYRSDNDYIEDGRLVVDDIKGITSERFRLICQLWPHLGPAPLRIIKKGRYGLAVTKTIYPKIHE